MCNNNCCTCCQCGTHDDDTPQEITYTSVCNSDVCKDKDGCRCCCCKNKGACENDPDVRLDGMEERMEECCEEVNERITNLECELCEEISRSTTKDEEHDEKIEDLYNKESLDYNNVDYTLDNHNLVVNFYHDDVFQDSITIPVESFIKDWFVDDVDLIDSHILRITFNTDPTTETHHEPRIIDIDLNDFLNPSNYYTKTQIDNMINPLSQSITNLTTNLNNYKTEVSNTYETKVAAGNHIKDVDYDQNDHHTLIFTKENGQTITKTIPDSDLYIQSGQYTGGNLVLTRNNNTTVTIPVPATNHIVGGSIDGRVITLVRENNGTPVTIQLPADANTYPVSADIIGNTLTITNSDGSTVPVTLPTDNDHYPTAGTVSNGVLTLTGNTGFSPVQIQLPADQDHNYYVTGGSVSGNTLTLTRNGGLSDVTVQLPEWKTTDNDHYVTSGTVTNGVLKLTRDGINGTVDITLPAGADGDHYPTQATLNGNTLTISGNTGFSPFSVDLSGISGTTNVTYGGDTVTLQQAITSIENRLNALEGLWEINPNDSTQVVAKNNRSAKAAGFYDSTVNTV